MRKFFVVLICFITMALTSFSQKRTLIEIETPGFVKTAFKVFKNSPIFSFVDIKIASNGNKAIKLNGLIEKNELEKIKFMDKQKRLKETFFKINNKQFMAVSQILFFDTNNNKVAEIFLPYNINLRLVDSAETPLLIVTKSIHHGTYYERIGYDIYDFKGNLIKSIKYNDVESIAQSINSHYLCFKSYNVNGYAAVFTLKRVKDMVEKQKNKTGQKAKVKNYTLKFHNLTPDFFLVLDNDENNPEVVTVFGGTIEKFSLKSKETVWKIEYIGGNVLDLKYNKTKETLNILLPHHQFTVIDAITGSIFKSFNPKNIPAINKYYKDFTIDLASIETDGKNLQFNMVSLDNTYLNCTIHDKDFKNIKIEKYKFNYNKKKIFIVRNIGNDYFLLSIKDSKITLFSLKKKDLFKKTPVTN